MEAERSREVGGGDVGRREFLGLIAGAMSLGAVCGCASIRKGRRVSFAEDILRYLEGLRRADGGYAWADQGRSHLTPTHGAIGCFHVIGREPPGKKRLAEFVRSHHPFRVKKLERDLRVFELEQIESLLWLGEDAGSFAEQVKGWRKPSVYPRQYERDGCPILQLEVTAFVCRRLLGLSMEDISLEFIGYLESRRRSNGSFNNTAAEDGGDGHVMNTWWGMEALEALGRSGEKRDETAAWVRRCQGSGGGFTHQPDAAFAAAEDVTYTWAAVRILELCASGPARRDACIEYLLSLRSADGGFGDRPGRASNPVATYRALDALRAVGGLERAASSARARTAPARGRALPGDLKVFTIQIEAPGRGSPVEAVELARALRIDLWGAKNAEAGWIARAQATADARKAPVTFFVSNEEYGTFVSVEGLGTYSHTSDVIAPADADFGPSLAGEGAVTWEEFRRRRLAPLERAGGRLVWQFGENEELTRLYLDDSLARGGYCAISTFHFGNPDFANSEPFLKHYQGEIPFVALQDAHGGESWWWGDQLAGFRTLFLAREATWEGWLEALARNWVVAVRHDGVSGFETWIHGGGADVVDFVRRRERRWRWWDNPGIERPVASIVAVRPGDRWEASRPERGVTIRVRCQRANTTQGLPKEARVELVRLTIDGRDVEPMLVAPKAKWGAYQDYYHYHHTPEPNPGRHTARAVVRVVATGAEVGRTIEFTA